MQTQRIHTASPAPNSAPPVRAADLPDAVDMLLAACLPAAGLAQWRQWLAAPRLRPLGEHGEQFRRGLLALTPHTIGAECTPAQAPASHAMSLEKVTVLAVSDRGVLLGGTRLEQASIIAELTHGPDDAMLDQLATRSDDTALWSVIDKQLRLAELRSQQPPVGNAELLGGMDAWVERADAILAQAVHEARLTREEHATALQALRRREEILRLQALTWLADALEADCLAMLSEQGGSPTCALYNWFASVAPIQRRHRLQALQSAPFLLDALIHACEPDAQPLTGLSQAVDQCQPLTPALASALGLRESEVRRLRTITHAECVRNDTVGSLRHLLERLQRLPPEHWPRTHADMDDALQRLYLCDWFAEMVGYSLPGASARLWLPDGAATRQFRQFAKRGWQTPIPAHSSGQAINEINDMLRALVSAADRPGVTERVAVPDRLQTLAEWPYRKWHRLARRWHDALQQVAPHFPYPDNLHWPPLLPPLTLGKRRIVFLTTPGALEEEGQTMRHCVAERIEDCLTGQAHVARLCDPDGTPRSTVQLVLFRQALAWHAEVQEHFGPRNQPPHADCKEAIGALLQHLATPAAQSRMARLASHHPADTTRLATWQHHGARQRARRNLAAFHIAMPGLLAPSEALPAQGEPAAAAFQTKCHIAQQADFNG